jgi:hypothetical protein
MYIRRWQCYGKILGHVRPPPSPPCQSMLFYSVPISIPRTIPEALLLQGPLPSAPSTTPMGNHREVMFRPSWDVSGHPASSSPPWLCLTLERWCWNSDWHPGSFPGCWPCFPNAVQAEFSPSLQQASLFPQTPYKVSLSGESAGVCVQVQGLRFCTVPVGESHGSFTSHRW